MTKHVHRYLSVDHGHVELVEPRRIADDLDLRDLAQYRASTIHMEAGDRVEAVTPLLPRLLSWLDLSFATG
jgi:hypothetical protein